jgi:glycosyltransferase involved in cell wall biosynthesis
MKNVTVLIPTLGTREPELKRLFESLTLQTYGKFEVMVVSQDNRNTVENICDLYKDKLQIRHLFCDKKGLSVARNYGIEHIKNSIVVLSDDDCWYPENGVERIAQGFEEYNCDILLTQIFDLDNKKLYKEYSDVSKKLKTFDLMSRSSIEIAFDLDAINNRFDENLGLGGKYVCGEEVDFLLNNRNKDIQYVPVVTVYHPKKFSSSSNQVVAKGYLYGKHFNIIVGILICIRDLVKKKENNFSNFFKGYVLGNKDKNI